jgi:hypothetical protein
MLVRQLLIDKRDFAGIFGHLRACVCAHIAAYIYPLLTTMNVTPGSNFRLDAEQENSFPFATERRLQEALNKSPQMRGARIGMGLPRQLPPPISGYWQEIQCRRPPLNPI